MLEVLPTFPPLSRVKLYSILIGSTLLQNDDYWVTAEDGCRGNLQFNVNFEWMWRVEVGKQKHCKWIQLSYENEISGMGRQQLVVKPAKFGTLICPSASESNKPFKPARCYIPPVRPSWALEALSWCSLCPGTCTDRCLDLTSGCCLLFQSLVLPVWKLTHPAFKILHANPFSVRFQRSYIYEKAIHEASKQRLVPIKYNFSLSVSVQKSRFC